MAVAVIQTESGKKLQRTLHRDGFILVIALIVACCSVEIQRQNFKFKKKKKLIFEYPM
jgi:hypothetical protein